uniref:Ig-like domain-containing protein n=1 Tax=Gadus morhua TaxID=8049 RepID=A0A8C5BH68_GADMO
MTNSKSVTCSQKSHECNITLAGEHNSGSYWCDSNSGERGEAVNITVTAGSVILESPVHPVPEGSPVTLRCLMSHKSSKKLVVVTRINQSCTFSRDGRLIGVGLTGEMSFAAVNRSHEGLYTCTFSGVESPGSWLAVRGYVSGPVSLTVSPSGGQVFEYESLSLGCDPADSPEGSSTCVDNWGSPSPGLCHLNFTKKYDTATYWCRSATGQHSNMVNITVHGGHVILESPVLPVMEGHNVTVSCRTSTLSPPFSADFYKDGLLVMTAPTARMTIYNVSKSDEGLYKCSVSGLGHSPESWLNTQGSQRTCSCINHPTYPSIYPLPYVIPNLTLYYLHSNLILLYLNPNQTFNCLKETLNLIITLPYLNHNLSLLYV